MWHNDKGFRMILGSTTRESASINEARRRGRRQYKNGRIVVRDWAVKNSWLPGKAEAGRDRASKARRAIGRQAASVHHNSPRQGEGTAKWAVWSQWLKEREREKQYSQR